MNSFAETMFVLAILLIVVTVVMCVCALIDMATRQRRFPNWFLATRTYGSPVANADKPEWELCFFRDAPGRKPTYRRIAVVAEGLLMKDQSPFVFPRPQTVFIPWSSLSNPREVTIPIWYLHAWRQGIELNVEGTDMTIAISENTWREIRENVVR